MNMVVHSIRKKMHFKFLERLSAGERIEVLSDALLESE